MYVHVILCCVDDCLLCGPDTEQALGWFPLTSGLTVEVNFPVNSKKLMPTHVHIHVHVCSIGHCIMHNIIACLQAQLVTLSSSNVEEPLTVQPKFTLLSETWCSVHCKWLSLAALRCYWAYVSN